MIRKPRFCREIRAMQVSRFFRIPEAGDIAMSVTDRRAGWIPAEWRQE
ncbi:MAG: hypothetical protein ACOYBC_01625 [Bilifractor sp.]